MSIVTSAITAMPSATRTKPYAIVRPLPMRSASAALRGETTTNVSAIGSVANPASSGEYPRANCRYSVKRKKKPNMMKNDVVTTALPTLNRRSEKNDSGNIGCGATRCQRMKPTMKTRATANAPTTRPSDQPRSGPSMMPNSKAVSPTSESTAPRGSSGVAASSRERGL